MPGRKRVFLLFLMGSALGCACALANGSPEKSCTPVPYMGKYCGVNCVRAVCGLYDLPMTWDLAAAIVQPDEQGANSLADLAVAFARLKLTPVGVRCTLDDIARFRVPAILHLNPDELQVLLTELLQVRYPKF